MKKIYGPYTRKDGRQHIIIYENGKRTTVSYPKYLLEQKLKRSLLSHETCDHIDGDYTNNNIDNLQILSKSENAKKHHAVHKKSVDYFVCPMCFKSFYKETAQARRALLKKKGPFCSKSCAGKHNANDFYARLKKAYDDDSTGPSSPAE